jgi:hypothetical protein
MKNSKENNSIPFFVNQLFLCVLFSICTMAVNAQVKFENFDSFDAMKKNAAKESKLIFVQSYSDDCQQCDELADKSLSNLLLKEKYNANFISAKIKPNQNFFTSVKDSALFKSSTGSFYFNSNGDLLLQYNSTTDFPYKYLELADQATMRSGRLNELLSIEKEYKSTKVKSPEFIRKYLSISKEFDRNVDFAVEEYFRQLPIDSIYNKSIIRLILEQGLPLNSHASQLIRSANPQRDIDSIWNTIDLSKRIAINSKVIALTESIAIRTKNENLANQLSTFIGNTYGKDFRKAYYYSNRMLLNFYKSIKDSKRYLRFSTNLIYTLMDVSNDTLAKWDLKEQQFSASSNREVRRYSKISCEYASQLNNIAWSYYEMVTDLEDLAKALKWEKRALEISSEVCKPRNNDNSAFLDTYAHLLYKMNQFDEAISWQKKAIEARKNAGLSSNIVEKELEKMQSRTLK